MCEFISWVEKNGSVLFLTAHDFKSSDGKRLIKELGDDDKFGHGFLRRYFHDAEGLPLKGGRDKECTDFSTPSNFPAEIVASLKSGDFAGLAVAPVGLLSGQAWSEYQKIDGPARAEYQKIDGPAWSEYQKIDGPAWSEYEKIEGPARAEYQKIEGPAWSEYEKIEGPARAEYQKIKGQALAEYEKIEGQARAEYEKIKGQAWDEYEKIKGTSFWRLFADGKNRSVAWR